MTVLSANARQIYLRAQERKRFRTSLGLTLAFYALVVLVLWIIGLGRNAAYQEYGGPVLIRIGTPQGVEIPAPPAPKVSEPVPQTAPPLEPAPAKAPLPSTPPPVTSSAKTAPAKPSESPPPAPTPTVPSTESVPAGPIKGEEHGNSHETSFNASAGRVGRALYVPIWTFMPLPKTVDNRVYDKIPGDGFRSAAERRMIFQKSYEYDSGDWRLKVGVRLDQRQALWLMLEDGGYDIAHADYKTAGKLSPIEIRFQVGPAQGNGPPVLESSEISQSSGDPEIDAAVLFGFRRASFSNDSAKSVTGRFRYSF